MSYENKEYILQFFECVHEEENRAELIEIYRKAEAFDRIVEQRKETGVITLGHYAFEIIREYESGESDA